MGMIGVAALVLVLVLASSAIGFVLQSALREKHRSRETLDAVWLVMSILVTFTALVLGLLTSTVKSSHDLFEARLRGFASDIIQLDQGLREYGESTDPIRENLRTYVAAAIADTWRDEPLPTGAYPTFPPAPDAEERQPLGALLVGVASAIRRLEPADTFHRKLADSLAATTSDTLAQRWMLLVTAPDTISQPLIILLTAWLAVIFGAFGLISPRNVVVYLTIIMCALSISSAVYLILEMDKPLEGFIRVSSAPFRDALRHIDAPR